MREQVVFGDSWVEVDLPDDTMTAPSGVTLALKPVDDLSSEIAAALDQPLDTPPLHAIARPGMRVLIAFDDPTVPCYAPVWEIGLDLILRRLAEAGVNEQDITLICANALHRQFTHGELSSLIGERMVRTFGERLLCHDAEDPGGMVHVGKTDSGFGVELNRLAVESDLVIYLNCSTTRGFSGGWKSICVGLSSYRSISHHHTPDIMSMSLDRNAMHAILDEMGALTERELGAERFFKVETVMSNPLQVGRVFAGSVGETRRSALQLNRSHLTSRSELVPEKADTVIYGVPSWSPYAAFSFMNPILTLISTGLGYLGGMIEALGKPGCNVILVTPCEDRWDEVHHPSYKEVWNRVLPETKDPLEARSMFEHEFATRDDYIEKYRHSFGFHGSHGVMALYPLKRLRHASRVIVAGPEDDRLPAHAGFEWAPDVASALSMSGPGRVAFVRYSQAVNRS